jgi:nucleotide-binding universal stress UspA family protein
MTTVIAAIDNSAAARPVLSAALEVARVLGAEVEAIHVPEAGGSTAEDAARTAGIVFRTVSGPVASGIVDAAEGSAVEAVVLGSRASVGGPRPAGHIALEVAARIRKPVVIVPPETSPDYRLHRVLVPMPGDPASSATLERAIGLAEGAKIEVIILHVHDMDSLPSFEDQAQHETAAWAQEFVARWAPIVDPDQVRMEVRVGAPSEEIVEAVHELEADLVVLGWAQDLTGGRAAVVRAVLGRAPVPVALVPVVVFG